MPSGGNGIDVTLSRQDKWSPMETFVRVKSKLRVVLKDIISLSTRYSHSWRSNSVVEKFMDNFSSLTLVAYALDNVQFPFV